jgi:hypothetical protein
LSRLKDGKSTKTKFDTYALGASHPAIELANDLKLFPGSPIAFSAFEKTLRVLYKTLHHSLYF